MIRIDVMLCACLFHTVNDQKLRYTLLIRVSLWSWWETTPHFPHNCVRVMIMIITCVMFRPCLCQCCPNGHVLLWWRIMPYPLHDDFMLKFTITSWSASAVMLTPDHTASNLRPGCWWKDVLCFSHALCIPHCAEIGSAPDCLLFCLARVVRLFVLRDCAPHYVTFFLGCLLKTFRLYVQAMVRLLLGNVIFRLSGFTCMSQYVLSSWPGLRPMSSRMNVRRNPSSSILHAWRSPDYMLNECTL